MSKDQIAASYAWFCREGTAGIDSRACETRDVFHVRLERFYRDVSSLTKSESDSGFLTAIAGEIGNNCFDHNLGQWRDAPGCWFEYGSQHSLFWMVIADRGQGVLSSLRRAAPDLMNDQQALETAFHKVLSGRSPERRGNGLKFVRSVINGQNNRGLFFASGEGQVTFGGLARQTDEWTSTCVGEGKGRGTFALVLWGFS